MGRNLWGWQMASTLETAASPNLFVLRGLLRPVSAL